MESNKTINIFTSKVGMTIENPWAGLASYEDPASSERKLKFCGRDDDTYDMVKLISKNVFVTLYGKSGIGKTSLLNAGVFPELREKQYTPISLRLGILKPTKWPSYQSIIIDAIKRASAHIVEFNVIDEQTNEKSDDYLWNFFARHRFFDIVLCKMFLIVGLFYGDNIGVGMFPNFSAMFALSAGGSVFVFADNHSRGNIRKSGSPLLVGSVNQESMGASSVGKKTVKCF